MLEDFGLSESEWDQLEDDQKSRLIQGQAKLSAQRQLEGNIMLSEDDENIRKRTARVQNSLLGQDTTDCVDTPDDEDMPSETRITVLGDYNQGDTAVQAKASNRVEVNEPAPPVQTEPKPSWVRNAILTGAALVAGGGLTYVALKALDRPDVTPVPITQPNVPSIYSIEAYD